MITDQHTRPTGQDVPPELSSAKIRLSPVQGFPRGPFAFRFDPSGILAIDGIYHVYYTRFAPLDDWFDLFRLPNHSQIWLATSEDGWHWTEVGQVLPDSPVKSWHRAGKHAPHVLHANGDYYLFYTAHVGPDYHNKRIGLAVAGDPAGPFRHVGDGPLLDAEAGSTVFDSVGQDDSCVFQRGGEFWWYFKGYGMDPERGQPINNRLCLAIADSPEGPYRRYGGNPVTMAHTGCLWPHGEGVAMISDVVDTSGAHAYPPCIQYSRDGVHFIRGGEIRATSAGAEMRKGMALCLEHWGIHIADPGVYCPEVSGAGEAGRGVRWGLSQLPDGAYATDPENPQHTPFIVRFDCDLRAGR